MSLPLLEVCDLVVEFATERGRFRAVDGLDFSLDQGETLGLVGESGCGKSVTALALMGLLPPAPTCHVSGSIRLAGTELLGQSERSWRRRRGRDLAMIFQEPMTALNPVLTIGKQLTRVLRRHQDLSRRQARLRAIDMLALTGISSPAQRINSFPHELSGGMRQRVMIAMAMSCQPRVLVADEPTTALDVTTQAQVLDQIVKLQTGSDMAVILISHDLGVVATACRRALVMYCGKPVEHATIDALFAAPAHPYTAGLLASMPRIRSTRLRRLPTIQGAVPDPFERPEACPFADRCEHATAHCREQDPPMTSHQGRQFACHHPLPIRKPVATDS